MDSNDHLCQCRTCTADVAMPMKKDGKVSMQRVTARVQVKSTHTGMSYHYSVVPSPASK